MLAHTERQRMPLDLTLKARLIIQIGLMAIFCFFEDGVDGLQLLLEDDLEFLLLLEEGGFLAIGSDEGRLELLDFEEEGGESCVGEAFIFGTVEGRVGNGR